MYSKQTTVVNKAGLHARPASEFVMKAKSFTADVTVRNMDKSGAAVNAKSIVRLLGEGLGTGTKIEIAAEGADEKAAVDALVALVNSGFGE